MSWDRVKSYHDKKFDKHSGHGPLTNKLIKQLKIKTGSLHKSSKLLLPAAVDYQLFHPQAMEEEDDEKAFTGNIGSSLSPPLLLLHAT